MVGLLSQFISSHFIVYTESRLQKMGKSNGLCHFCNNNIETLQHLFFQCLKIKPIIEELNTILLHYVLDEDNIMLGIRLAAASDNVYQLLAHGLWFSPGIPASSTTKTDRHNIAEILLII
jgi:hypothetical protein